MDLVSRSKGLKKKHVFIVLSTAILLTVITVKSSGSVFRFSPRPRRSQCPFLVPEDTITPLNNTRHFLVSGYVDRRRLGLDVRLIGIFRRDAVEPLRCLFCCADRLSPTTPATVLPHPENFGFPYVATDVVCGIPPKCNATHVALLTGKDEPGPSEPPEPSNHTWFPLGNRESGAKGEEKPRFNLTVCISNLFGEYDNVLQFAQTMEMYRLLGVNRVVIYKTSCSRAFERLLQAYSRDGLLEVVPWPIERYLNPSRGWLRSESGGDVHYYGQMATLNECVYRSMERSRYVLLSDMDEIVMPYQHDHLMALMDALQPQHPDTGVFLIENHIFPKKHFEPSGRFHLARWDGVPGVNVLEHVYREEPDRTIYHPYKMIVRPRMVEQTSVHDVLQSFGQRFKVPPEVCRIIHVRTALQGALALEELHVDRRLWDFQEKLVPRVDAALRSAGLMDAGDAAE